MHTAPKYQQLAAHLRRQIALGEFAPDAQIPTEWQLVAHHAVSRGTVRQALTVLEQAGLIRREQGRGMFVNPPRAALPAFTISEGSDGAAVSSIRTPTAELITADSKMAAKLQLKAGAPVFHVVQLRYNDNAPVMVEERWLAARWYPALLEEGIGQTPMHWILVHRARLPLVRLAHTIDVRLPNTTEAAALQLTGDVPVFAIDRLTYTRDGESIIPAVWYRALCRAEDYELKAQFWASL